MKHTATNKNNFFFNSNCYVSHDPKKLIVVAPSSADLGQSEDVPLNRHRAGGIDLMHNSFAVLFFHLSRDRCPDRH